MFNLHILDLSDVDQPLQFFLIHDRCKFNDRPQSIILVMQLTADEGLGG